MGAQGEKMKRTSKTPFELIAEILPSRRTGQDLTKLIEQLEPSSRLLSNEESMQNFALFQKPTSLRLVHQQVSPKK